MSFSSSTLVFSTLGSGGNIFRASPGVLNQLREAGLKFGSQSNSEKVGELAVTELKIPEMPDADCWAQPIKTLVFASPSYRESVKYVQNAS